MTVLLSDDLHGLLKTSPYNKDDLIITMFQVKFNLGKLNTDHLVWLGQNNLIRRGATGLELTCKLFSDDEISEYTPHEFEVNVDEYRALFKGVRRGSMGDKSIVKDYLQRFMSENPEYSFEDILEVTREYVRGEYVSNADNFIYKIKDGKNTSMLRMCLEEGIINNNNNKFI